MEWKGDRKEVVFYVTNTESDIFLRVEIILTPGLSQNFFLTLSLSHSFFVAENIISFPGIIFFSSYFSISVLIHYRSVDPIASQYKDLLSYVFNCWGRR